MHEIVLSPRYVVQGKTIEPFVLKYENAHDAEVVAEALKEVQNYRYASVEVKKAPIDVLDDPTDAVFFDDLDNSGRHMTFAEFLDNVKKSSLIDRDGCGYLATATQESDVRVVPSNVHQIFEDNPKYREWATHVMWFNR